MKTLKKPLAPQDRFSLICLEKGESGVFQTDSITMYAKAYFTEED